MKADIWAVTSLLLYFLIVYIVGYYRTSVTVKAPLLSVFVILFIAKDV